MLRKANEVSGTTFGDKISDKNKEIESDHLEISKPHSNNSKMKSDNAHLIVEAELKTTTNC